MSFKLQATMASDETKPRRFDLSMSRRTRRPAATIPAISCHEQDHLQAVDVEGLGFQPVVGQPERQDLQIACSACRIICSHSNLSWMDAHQEHETSEQRSEDTTKEQAPPPQTRRLVEKDDDESEAQQQKEEEECQDNSCRFSLQELIEDEAVVDDGGKDAATGGTKDNAAAAAAGGGACEVAEGAAAAVAEKRPAGQHVVGRRVIGIMRRYVKVRSIKPKRASPEKNVAPEYAEVTTLNCTVR